MSERSWQIANYWQRVVELGPHPRLPYGGRRTIHHVHSGSVSEAGIVRGTGRKTSDWLVICLPHDLHVGNRGIDYGYGVKRWEDEFGTQLDLLRWTSNSLGADVFTLAGHPHLSEQVHEVVEFRDYDAPF